MVTCTELCTQIPLWKTQVGLKRLSRNFSVLPCSFPWVILLNIVIHDRKGFEFKLQSITYMAEEEKPIIKKPPPYAPTKFLLSSLNTFFGNILVRRLRNEHKHPQNPNRILGTVSSAQPDMSVPDGVRKVIDTGKIKFFQEIILNSDVIIYDLNTCDLKEAQFVISTLKMHNFNQNKTLICVSNVMTWAKTKPKEKKEGEEEQGEDNPPQEPDTEVEGGDPAAEGEQKKVYVRFQDKDYALRKPDPNYQKIKSIETLCMAAGKVKPNLKTYIICSGLLYGQGQRLLAPYFMQARLQKPEALVYYGTGKNRIPMIHVEDLITFVQKTIEKKPNLPYIFAIDHNPKPTQKKIIESISQGVGTGKTKSEEVKNQNENTKMLTLNLRIKPTMYFQKIEEEEAAVQQEEGNEIPKFTFKWQYKEGIQKSIKRLCEQFNNCRGLKQTKIFVTGPPGSGKTYYSAQLSSKYNLPHIHIKGVINEVKALPGEFGDEIRNYLTEKKEEQVAELQAKYEEEKQKQKKIPKELRELLEPVNPQKYEVRLPDELIYKCFKWRLNQNDCLNRGYVLDSYPRKYEDAAEIFMGLPPVEQGQEPEENAKKIVEPKLIPDKLVILDVSDQQILKRIQTLDQQLISGTHLNQKDTKRRLKVYRKYMDSSTGEFVLEDFFKQNKVQIYKIDTNAQTSNVLESIIKPLALHESQHQDVIKKKIEAEEEKRKRTREEVDKKHNIIRNVQNEDYMMKKENQQNEERDILDKSSLALRKYLDVNLVPILSQGIVKILNDFPEDPVDFLAQFLFENSLKVPNPDPSTFEL